MRIFKTFRFESAHRLPHVPEGHKCGRLHGHSYVVDVHVEGPVGRTSGWVVDFAEIEAAWRPLDDALDHRLLNEVEGLENPTSEVLAAWIYRCLEGQLPTLESVTVSETCDARVVFRGGRGAAGR